MSKVEVDLRALDNTSLGVFEIPRKSKPQVILYQGKAYQAAEWDLHKYETLPKGSTGYFRQVFREVEMYTLE